ncbi:MAG: hypothetical protein ACPGJS_12415 [Flammeovirgaceae bacterium]
MMHILSAQSININVPAGESRSYKLTYDQVKSTSHSITGNKESRSEHELISSITIWGPASVITFSAGETNTYEQVYPGNECVTVLSHTYTGIKITSDGFVSGELPFTRTYQKLLNPSLTNVGPSYNIFSGTESRSYQNPVGYCGSTYTITYSIENVRAELTGTSYRPTELKVATNNLPNGYSTAVGGKAYFEGIDIAAQADWPDYVFDEAYPLLPLSELKAYVEENKHLPNVPSAATIETQGWHDAGATTTLLLEKTEELTLYTLQHYKAQQELKAQAAAQEAMLNRLELLAKQLKKKYTSEQR